ncbi:MAG: hypothetical protein D6732_23065 [Methanobacteriota archaeon]|nr:MAG: hypothetical protein D6732_23065 [Euryarchaeota archaeon]
MKHSFTLKPVLGMILRSIREIHIISMDVFNSNLRERKILLAVLYYVLTPLVNLLVLSFVPIVQKGTGIAIFQAQFATTELIKTYFVSFFLGQILIALLTADQIAGEVERETLVLLRSKPIHDASVVIGKYLGMMYTLCLMILPVSVTYYFSVLGIYGATWPETFVRSLDEILAVAFLIVLMLGVVISLAILASSIFNKSLHAIIATLLGIFGINLLGDAIFGKNNYMSLSWYVDAIFPNIFYNLEPLEDVPNGIYLTALLLSINVIIVFLSSAILINKEIY